MERMKKRTIERSRSSLTANCNANRTPLSRPYFQVSGEVDLETSLPYTWLDKTRTKLAAYLV
jgi:hypothetical protein